MTVFKNEQLIADVVPVINGEYLALSGIENLNNVDEWSSEEDDNDDG